LYISSRNGVAKSISRLAYRIGATPEMIALPVEGSTFGIDASMDHDGIVFGLESWIIPLNVYRYDPSTHELIDTKLQPNNPLDLSGFQVREVQTTSTDGARVPISIIFRKGITLDGSHPTRVTDVMDFLLMLNLILRLSPGFLDSVFACCESMIGDRAFRRRTPP
jgi:prolyl oligopeptidase